MEEFKKHLIEKIKQVKRSDKVSDMLDVDYYKKAYRKMLSSRSVEQFTEHMINLIEEADTYDKIVSVLAAFFEILVKSRNVIYFMPAFKGPDEVLYTQGG